MIRPALHFIGFRGDEYVRAVRVFGEPDFIHIGWDTRAAREIHPTDTLVFGPAADPESLSTRNYSDTLEKLP